MVPHEISRKTVMIRAHTRECNKRKKKQKIHNLKFKYFLTYTHVVSLYLNELNFLKTL
jgi:hypothetical protein